MILTCTIFIQILKETYFFNGRKNDQVGSGSVINWPGARILIHNSGLRIRGSAFGFVRNIHGSGTALLRINLKVYCRFFLPALLLTADPSLHISRVFEYTENKMLNKNIDHNFLNKRQVKIPAIFFQKIIRT